MKVVVVLSGGMDSATALAQHLANGDECHVLSINYGQRHNRELISAVKLFKYYNDKLPSLCVEHKIVDLRSIKPLINNSSQTGDTPVPHGHYAEENMKQTVVPNRNMILCSVAIGWAVNLKADFVSYGAHDGDHAIYPDCRPEFAELLNQCAQTCDWHKVELIAPFSGKDKGDIAIRGKELQVPYDLTWTCYEGKTDPCGKCGACQERAEAFAKAEMPDPLIKLESK